MRLHMIIKLLARELALANFVLVLVRRDAVFFDTITMAVFNGLGDVDSRGGFVVVRWLADFRRIQGDRRSGRSGAVVEGCGADGSSCGEPREGKCGVRGLDIRGKGRRGQRVLECTLRRDESS